LVCGICCFGDGCCELRGAHHTLHALVVQKHTACCLLLAQALHGCESHPDAVLCLPHPRAIDQPNILHSYARVTCCKHARMECHGRAPQVWVALPPFHKVHLGWYAHMLRLHMAWHRAAGAHKYLLYVTQQLGGLMAQPDVQVGWGVCV
jgi:hypothetical protein